MGIFSKKTKREISQKYFVELLFFKSFEDS